METPLLDGIRKEAIIGPLGDLGNIGIPSLIGSIIGKSVGKGEPEIQAKKKFNPLWFALIPGYTGYHIGRKNEAKSILRETEERRTLAEKP